MIMLIDIIVLQFKGDFLAFLLKIAKSARVNITQTRNTKNTRNMGNRGRDKKKGKLITEKLICCDPFV